MLTVSVRDRPQRQRPLITPRCPGPLVSLHVRTRRRVTYRHPHSPRMHHRRTLFADQTSGGTTNANYQIRKTIQTMIWRAVFQISIIPPKIRLGLRMERCSQDRLTLHCLVFQTRTRCGLYFSFPGYQIARQQRPMAKWIS